MKFAIKNRFTGKVQFECELSAEVETASDSIKMGFAVKAALKERAYLVDADLARAYLAGANLARADLAGADLAGAYLAGADLAGADRLLRTIDAGPGSPPEGGFDAPPGAKAFTPRGEAETDTTTEGDET